MQGRRKFFDKALYEANDTAAREAIKKVFANDPDHVLMDNPKKRGVDVLVYKKGQQSLEHKFNIEVEIKKVWTSGPEFPWPEINFPERKGKYAQLDKPTIFVMFDSELKNYLAITSDELISSPLKEVNNRFLRAGELFFKVDVNKAVINDINAVIKKLGV